MNQFLIYMNLQGLSEKKKIHLGEAWYIFQESVMNIDTNNIE